MLWRVYDITLLQSFKFLILLVAINVRLLTEPRKLTVCVTTAPTVRDTRQLDEIAANDYNAHLSGKHAKWIEMMKVRAAK